MANLRPVTLSENPASSWQNLIQRTIQSQNVIAGNGLVRSLSGGDFTQLSLASEANVNHMIYRGTYDPNLEYFVNDVVRVLPDKHYIDPKDHAQIPIGSTDIVSSSKCPMSMGLFVCVKHVPPGWATPDYFFSQVLASFPETVPYNWIDGTRWTDHNVYYPLYPEIPTQYTSSVHVNGGSGGFDITANDTFWNAMPFGTITMKACIDGVTYDFYVLGNKSGSLFQEAYLPAPAP